MGRYFVEKIAIATCCNTCPQNAAGSVEWLIGLRELDVVSAAP